MAADRFNKAAACILSKEPEQIREKIQASILEAYEKAKLEDESEVVVG